MSVRAQKTQKYLSMNVKNSELNRFNRWELFQFLDDVLTATELQDEGMSELYNNKLADLRAAFETLDDALVQERNTSPEGLIDAEEKRDYAVRKIYSIAKEYSDYRFDKEKEDAGTALVEIFKPYGTGYAIAMMPQDAETAVLTNLMQDMMNKDGGESLEKLSLVNVYDELMSKNNLFKEKQFSRRKEESEFVAGVVKTARTNAQNEFMAFVAIVNALAIVEGQEKYSELKKTINRLLEKYVATAKQRTTKREEETPEEVIQ